VVEQGSPQPATHVKKLKNLLRKLPKAPTLGERDIDRVAEQLGISG